MSAPLIVDFVYKMWYAMKRAEERCLPDIMGVRYRDYLKGSGTARRRARQAIDTQTAIEARAKAIREKNRQAKAHEAQYVMRMWTDAS